MPSTPTPIPPPLPAPSATPSLQALLAREDLLAGKPSGTGLPPGLRAEDLVHLSVQDVRRVVDQLEDAAAAHDAAARAEQARIHAQHTAPALQLRQQASNTLSSLLYRATPEQLEVLRELYPASDDRGPCCRFARVWPGCVCARRWRCKLHGERHEGSHD